MDNTYQSSKRIRTEEMTSEPETEVMLKETNSVNAFLEDPSQFSPRAFLVNTYIEDDTILTHAVKTQNIVAVLSLIKAGIDANVPNKKGVTPISAAAHKGNIVIMQALIDANAAVNALNTSGSTALIQASHFGHADAVRLLLRHNASSDFANLKGTTALMRASQEGHVPISKLLILSGADVNRKNHEGMNALMLSSQRGHADMVLLLIKAGASMDEQTSQGSTALMLACKRGHDKVVEVLVSMGAEIFMKDCRGRTARDTATRRQHLSLLRWLDSQVQVSRIQDHQRKQRSVLLARMRMAHRNGNLKLAPEEQRVATLIQSVLQEGTNNRSSTSSTSSDSNSSINSFFTSSILSNTLTEDMAVAGKVVAEILNPVADMPAASPPLRQKQPKYADWMWPMLLQRCMNLPPGIFEKITEMLPAPRVWQWSLWRLRRRCKVAPQQAVADLCVMMDEILVDMNLFAEKNQTTLLAKLARNPQIHKALIADRGMPAGLLEMLITWSDVQSLASRASELEVNFKAALARKLLAIGMLLFKWQRHLNSGTKALGLLPLANAQTSGSTSTRKLGVNGDALESTDVCVEVEGSDEEGGMDQDQDTETEMPIEGENEDAGEADSDLEDDNAVHMGIF